MKLNRIKVILADRGLTNKWLAETIHRDSATISKWVTTINCQTRSVGAKLANLPMLQRKIPER